MAVALPKVSAVNPWRRFARLVSRPYVIPFACGPILLSSCGFFDCAPEECREAVEGRELYQPVIVAIAAYREDNKVYPESLMAVTPKYLPAMPKSDEHDGPREPEYIRVDDSYEFSFMYFGPGVNICTFSPEEEWTCYGYY